MADKQKQVCDSITEQHNGELGQLKQIQAGEARREDMSLTPILKEYRKQYGLSQFQLAETLGVDERTLRRWEHQETRLTDVRELRRLASVLGVQAERLGVTDQAGGISPEQA